MRAVHRAVWVVVAAVACGPSTPDEWLAEGRSRLEAGDEEAAAAAFDEACRGGSVDGCSLRWPLTVGSVDAVRFAMERSCEGADAAACAARAETAGDHYDRRACELGSGPACLRSADQASDEPSRRRFLAAACHAGATRGCLPASDAARRAGDRVMAAALLDARCALQGPTDVACALALAVREELTDERACEQGAQPGCRDACASGSTTGCRAAAPLLREACDGGDGAACRLLARTLPEGEVPQVLWKGCDEVGEVDPWSCLALADVVEAGAPLPSAARGDVAWLRNQGCDLQLDFACAHLAGP